MNIENIEKLVKLIDESGLTEFTYKDEEMEVSLSKKQELPPAAPVMPMPMGMPMGMPAAGEQVPAAAAEEDDDEDYITSPIVGTFYSASAPDAPAYVRVGDKVKNGEVVCILEAMKLMNEIQAEYDCQIDAVLVSNEQKVEYGQPLFRVKRLK